MNYRKTYPLLFAFFLLIGAVGCTDVGVNPKSSASAENALSSDGAYRSFLAKLYAGLSVVGQVPSGDTDISAGVSDNGSQQYMRLYWELQELPTDEAVIAWADITLQDFNTMEWGDTDVFNEAMYSRIFFQVAQANEFLRESTQGTLESRGISAEVQAQMPQWRAEARFLRALSYWHALDLYDEVPLVDEDFPRGAEAPPQATRAELYSFIESELLEITGESSESSDEVLAPMGQAPYGRADRGAAYMLLSKLYLNTDTYRSRPEGDSSFGPSDPYAEVVEYTSRVINGPYTLDSEYGNLFLADNNTADGLIYTIPQDGQNQQSFGGTTFLAHASLGGSLTSKVGDLGLDSGWAGLRGTPTFASVFDPADTRPAYLTEDLLPGSFFSDLGISPGQQFYTQGQTLEVSAATLTSFSNGYIVPKYRNITSNGEGGSDLTFADIDFPLFRLADAHLMYAEAFLRGNAGSQGEAVSLVNDLRERAFGDASNNISAGDLNLEFILDERSRELHWEAQRRTDLIRFERFTDNSVRWGGKPASVDESRRLYPIPLSELQANPNITQNPGY